MSGTQRRVVMCGHLVYLFGVLSWALFTLKATTDSNNAMDAARMAMARQIMIAQGTERWQGFRAHERIEYAKQVKEAVGRYGFPSYHQDDNVKPLSILPYTDTPLRLSPKQFKSFAAEVGLPFRVSAGGSTYFSGKAVRTFNKGVEVADLPVDLEHPDWNRLPMLEYRWIDVTIPPGVYKMDHPFRPLPYRSYHMRGVAIETTAQCGIEPEHDAPFAIEGGFIKGAKYAWCGLKSAH